MFFIDTATGRSPPTASWRPGSRWRTVRPRCPGCGSRVRPCDAVMRKRERGVYIRHAHHSPRTPPCCKSTGRRSRSRRSLRRAAARAGLKQRRGARPQRNPRVQRLDVGDVHADAAVRRGAGPIEESSAVPWMPRPPPKPSQRALAGFLRPGGMTSQASSPGGVGPHVPRRVDRLVLDVVGRRVVAGCADGHPPVLTTLKSP